MATENRPITQTNVTLLATTSTVLLALNSLRKTVTVQNLSTTDTVYLGVGVTATTSGLKLLPGSAWEPFEAPSNAINAYSTGTPTLLILEG